ncbi:hypothetical protein ACFYZ9_39545 [Streptomyces sp. NPDC001691]|uniref:hypothetical protein n=1 Tax=Streptomyces sp. NPDC001691 TaxID=3364600 RepID=UPI0036C0AC94
MGLVNSLRRLRYAEAMGCATVDGAYVVFAPDIKVARCLSCADALEAQRPLF